MPQKRTLPRRPLIWAALALLAGLLPLLLGITDVRAQQQEPPAQPAQDQTKIYLPALALPGKPAPEGSPVIESFQISSASGPMADEVELRWRVRGATRLQIEPGVGDVLGATSAIVYPIATTTYTLTATNDRGSVTATTTYTVDALPEPNPITVSARPDNGRAASANIGAAGGVVEATGADGTRYKLSVPAEALLYTEAITLTPVAGIDKMPFATKGVHAVSIAPEGLIFAEPATLTITPPAAPAKGSHMVGFAYQGTGAEFHLRTVTEAGKAELAQAGASVVLNVTTTSSFGTAPIDDDELLAPLVPRAPTNPADRAEHAYNAALDEAVESGLRRLLLMVQLENDFELGVEIQLVAASKNPEGPAPFDLESAVRDYIKWRARVRQAGMTDAFRDEISRANLSLGEALRKAGQLASDRCNQGRPAQGFALQRYMNYAKRFGLTNTYNALENQLASCWVFKLTFQSYMDQQDGDIRMEYEVKASLPLNYQPGGQMIGSTTLAWEHFSVTPVDGCTLTIGPHQNGTFKVDGEGMGLRLEPVSRTSPNVNFTLTYQVGEPTAKWSFICEKQEINYTSPFWWVAYYETHVDERLPNSNIYTAQALNTHPNSFTGWVYDLPIPGGLGDEHTEIRLEHAPGS